MRKLGLASLLLLILFTSFNKPIEISFAGIQSFEEAKNKREALFKKFTESDQEEDAKTQNLNSLDAMYWEHVSSLLNEGRSVILNSPTRAFEKHLN
jgi:hypothetical protein